MKKIMLAFCLILLIQTQWIEEEGPTTELAVEDQSTDIAEEIPAPDIQQDDVISPERIKPDDYSNVPQESTGNPFQRSGPKPQKDRPTSRDPFASGNRQPQSEEEMNKMREERMKEFSERRNEGKGGNRKSHRGKPDSRQSESSFSLQGILNSEWGVLLFVGLGLALVVKLCCTKKNGRKNLRKMMRQQVQPQRERVIDPHAQPMQLVSQNEHSVDEQIIYHEQQLNNLRRIQHIPVGQPLPYQPMNIQIYQQ